MTVFLTPDFLEDIKSSQDARFIRRVLTHVCDEEASFGEERNDHRYDGIADAWIRYVSSGRTAFRMIYIRRGSDIYIYRAGVHAVEDNLAPPKQLTGHRIESIEAPQVSMQSVQSSAPTAVLGELVKTSQKVMLSRLISSMIHVPHKEIVLVSPYYSESVLNRQSPFGRFLDKAVEENTFVHLVTKEPTVAELDFFQLLEERGILVYFHPRLHAKLYLFDIDEENLGQYHRELRRTAILGSANLTEMGLALAGKVGNEELCYVLPPSQFQDARDHATWLIKQSTDFVTYRLRTSRRY